MMKEMPKQAGDGMVDEVREYKQNMIITCILYF